jgi:hypothetical protein
MVCVNAPHQVSSLHLIVKDFKHETVGKGYGNA